MRGLLLVVGFVLVALEELFVGVEDEEGTHLHLEVPEVVAFVLLLAGLTVPD